MRYVHAIETTDDTQTHAPIWYAVGPRGDAEDYDGTAAEYGREVLRKLIDENQEVATVDEYGNPLLRVLVAFAADEDAFANDANRVCVIESNDVDEPPAELAALEAAREQKLYARLLDRHADEALEESVPAARAAGYGANRLADLVAPAISRPVALKLAQRFPDYLAAGHRVAVPEYSVPEGWARKGEVVAVDEQTAVVELDDGHRQELPLDELLPERPPKA